MAGESDPVPTGRVRYSLRLLTQQRLPPSNSNRVPEGRVKGASTPVLLPLPHPRGRAPRSAARLPGSRRAAATAAPARQPAPRRAHGARAPHFLSPKPRPADHSPGQSPAAAAAVVTGEAWRWDRSGAPHKGTGRGPERQEDRRTDRRTDKHGTRGRSSGAAGAVMGPAHRGLLVNRKMHSPTHHTCVPQV